MGETKRRLATAFLVGAVVAAAAPAALGATAPGGGFDTSRPAQLVATEPGVVIDPILSTGDVVGDYQMTGIPDGLGAYKNGTRKLEIVMNHELDGIAPPVSVGSRISKVTIDRATRKVLAASYLFTGLEGFVRFCSATLATFNGRPLYFTGEEDTPDRGRNGSSIVLDPETGEWDEMRHLGLILHENNVPVKRLSKAFILTTDDDFREPSDGFHAYLYAYIADTWDEALSGDGGALHVWQALGGPDSSNDIAKGQTIPGRFVELTDAETATAATLEAASLAKGFRFSRLEDAATARQHPGRVYFVDTGKLRSETVKGRLYRLDIDPSDPTQASLKLLLDGDTGDDLVNPDNIDTSPQSVVIQEDRNSEHRGGPGRPVPGRPDDLGYGRILVYDIKSGSVRAVAIPATPVPAQRPGDWESSGVINAQTLLGEDWWLVDVQAHGRTAPQPGLDLQPTLVPNGEDGQLLAIKIPRS